MRFLYLFLLLLSLASAQARLLKNEVTGKETLTLTFKEACHLQGQMETLLVDPVGSDKLDCMGKSIKIEQSCLKKRENGFLKAFISEKEIVCEYGKQVIVSVSCDERDAHYCKNAQKSCEKLKNLFARNLSPLRESVVERTEGKVLNCFFDEAK